MTCRVLVNTRDTSLFLCGSGSDVCRCACPGTCEHVWDGGQELHDSQGRVNGWTLVCSRCGMAAIDHDIRVLP